MFNLNVASYDIYLSPPFYCCFVLLLGHLLSSCNWKTGDCGYDADRCRQPGKEGHGKWVSEGSSYANTSRPRSPLRGGDANAEYHKIDFERRMEMTEFVLQTVPNELKKELSLEELEELNKQAKYWLERVNSYGSFDWRHEIKSNEEAEQKLREALVRIEERRKEVEAKVYEAEQVALGKRDAQISKEADLLNASSSLVRK